MKGVWGGEAQEVRDRLHLSEGPFMVLLFNSAEHLEQKKVHL